MSGATGYRASATLSVWAEVRRQASRRRTQLALGFMVLLPVIVLLSFEFGSGGDDDNGGGQFASLVDLATSGGLNFALFTIFVSSSFLTAGLPATGVWGVAGVIPVRRRFGSGCAVVSSFSSSSSVRSDHPCGYIGSRRRSSSDSKHSQPSRYSARNSSAAVTG